MPDQPQRPLPRRLAGAAAARLPDAWRAALFRRTAKLRRVAGVDRGLVTVVVVVDPLDLPRLADSLASIGGQTHAHHEVLLAPVGDADLPRTRDHRVRALPSRPTWWEAANAATTRARGRWVLWHRGCDLLAPTALADLAAPDAEVATGVLAQRGSAEAWLDRAQQLSHPAGGHRGEPSPEQAADLVLGNTLVRREHWRGRRFSADDTWLLSPTLAGLLRHTHDLAALDATVAEHLHDHGRRAFAATPSALPALSGWQRAADRMEQVLAGSRLEPGWHRTVLDVALPRFLADAERATGPEWRQLHELVRTQLARDPRAADAVGVRARALLWLAEQDRRDDVAALAAEIESLGPDLRCHLDGPDLYVHWESVGAPADLRRLGSDETPLLAEVRAVRRQGDIRVVDVFCRVPHLDLTSTPPLVDARAAGQELEVEVVPDPAATRWAGERFAGNDQGSLRLTVSGQDRCEVTLRLTVGALARETIVVVPALTTGPAAPDVRSVHVDGDHLVVAGAPVQLVDDRDRVVAEQGPDGRVPLVTTRWGRTAPLPTGRYRLRTGHRDPTFPDDVASETLGVHHRVRVFRGPHGGLVVALAPPLADDELGPRAQQLLREAYAAEDRRVDPTAWYLDSYAGRSATDSPLAIHEELRRRRHPATTYWGVADHGQWAPEGATPLLIGSRAWYDVLATAGVIVTNTDVESWFRRRDDQLVVQTFHGYPSKAMGESQWRALELRPAKVREARARGVDSWSLIITPTPEATGYYRDEYGYAGPVVEHGYPRDDALVADAAADRRHEVRDLLGIGDRTAVLYAPTWRDHLATRPRGAAMADFLDVDAFADALGDSHVLLLRGHRFNAPGADRRGVLDVTDHPEVNDLLLASDVAVLDYSSLRFDAALTGMPMVFLVPDLAEYDAGTRAFLHPFRETAPGPLVTTTEEVVAEVRDAARLRVRWAEAIEAMNQRWNPHQDGHAAGRVVDAVDALLRRAG